MIVRIQVSTTWTALIRWASHLLLATGTVLIAVALWAQIESALYQSVQARHFTEGTAEPAAAPTPRLLAPLTMLGPADPLLVGRLEIPRLGLAAMVREGVEPATLRRAVGHLPGTALPGKAGNFVLAGHRDSFFRGLRLIHNGDEIRVRTWNGAFTYRVTELSVVDPGDTQAVQPTTTSVCTLVTCFPFDYVGPAPRRYIVRAEMRDQAATRPPRR
jgi:sortase A